MNVLKFLDMIQACRSIMSLQKEAKLNINLVHYKNCISVGVKIWFLFQMKLRQKLSLEKEEDSPLYSICQS